MVTAEYALAGTRRAPSSVRLPDGRTVLGSRESRADIRYLYREIFERKCYEQHGIEISGQPTVVDVGANIGLYALRVTDLAPRAKVFCFEPAPPTYACLKANVTGRPGVVTFNAALMEAPQTLEIAFYPHSPGNSTLFPEQKAREIAQFSEQWTLRRMWQLNKFGAVFMGLTYPVFHRLQRFALNRLLRGASTFRCRAMTLDQLFEEQRIDAIDLLKVDVEGAEQAVFDGLSQPNLERVRQAVVEISPGHKAWIPTLEARLTCAGFDRLVFESVVPGGDPRTDAYPCNIYATRSRT
jgi:FkbM family methyltransferase